METSTNPVSLAQADPSTNFYFVTCTFPFGLMDKKQTNKIVAWMKHKCLKYYIFQEQGKSKDNPHVHAVLQTAKEIDRPDNWKRNCYRSYTTKEQRDNIGKLSHLVDVRKCTDYKSLLFKYAHKEANTLVWTHGFDLEKLKEEWINRVPEKPKELKYFPKYSMLPHTIVQYNPFLTKETFKETIMNMIHDGYLLTPHLRNLVTVRAMALALINQNEELEELIDFTLNNNLY